MPKKQKKIRSSELRKIKRAVGNSYISRARALRKLQLTLHQFRRLCVVKGIHPVDPNKKGLSKDRTFYHMMDVRFMAHDPMIKGFRDYNVWKKKTTKLKRRGERERFDNMVAKKKPMNIDHVVRERYPTFNAALNDLEDPLCLIFICARMKNNKKFKSNWSLECVTLAREFMTYVAESKSLRKVFVTIKGIYYEAEIMGVTVRWLAPFEFAIDYDDYIDTSLIVNFVEFYITLMRFVNFKLFNSLGFKYPPEVDTKVEGLGEAFSLNLCTVEQTPEAQEVSTQNEERIAQVKKAMESAEKDASDATLTDSDKQRIAGLASKLGNIASADADDDEEEEVQQEKDGEIPKEVEVEGEATVPSDFLDEDGERKKRLLNLFKGKVFFLNREVPYVHLAFMIKSFGGVVSHQYGDIPESSDTITHQVVDREFIPGQLKTTREYVQPQWVFDSINSGILLPVHEYASNATLPPHLSPFENSGPEGYVPEQRKHLDELIARAEGKWDEKEEEEGEEEEEEEEEDDEATLEARYQRELKRERAGESFSAVTEKHEAENAARKQKLEEKMEFEKKVNARAGLHHLNDQLDANKKVKKQKKGKKGEVDEDDEEYNRQLQKNVMNAEQRRRVYAIERDNRLAQQKRDAIEKRVKQIEQGKRDKAKNAMRAEEVAAKEQAEAQAAPATKSQKNKKAKSEEKAEAPAPAAAPAPTPAPATKSQKNKKAKSEEKAEAPAPAPTPTPAPAPATKSQKNKKAKSEKVEAPAAAPAPAPTPAPATKSQKNKKAKSEEKVEVPAAPAPAAAPAASTKSQKNKKAKSEASGESQPQPAEQQNGKAKQQPKPDTPTKSANTQTAVGQKRKGADTTTTNNNNNTKNNNKSQTATQQAQKKKKSK